MHVVGCGAVGEVLFFFSKQLVGGPVGCGWQGQFWAPGFCQRTDGSEESGSAINIWFLLVQGVNSRFWSGFLPIPPRFGTTDEKERQKIIIYYY
jgi:hypothetical protein